MESRFARMFAFIAFSYVMLAVAFPISGEVVDPRSMPNPLLESLSPDLDRLGIDTRFGSNGGTASPIRPQVTPLVTFESNVGSINGRSIFQHLFHNGVAHESILVAIDNNSREEVTRVELFDPDWNASPTENRVFISFSSKDVDAARALQTVLLGRGFETFMYLKGDGTWTSNAVGTGNYFRTAGQRLVIDTANSRNSPAIATEARAAKEGWWHEAVPPNSILSESGDGLCCKICEVINGMVNFASCSAPTCGPECNGATQVP